MRRTCLIAMVLVGLVGSAQAAPLAPTKPSQVVTLSTSGAPCPLIGAGAVFDTRIGPDGVETPFSIPPKQVLVITGLNWVSSGGTPGEPTGVFLRTPPSASAAPIVFRASALANAAGSSTGSALVPQVVVRSGTPVCLYPTGTQGALHGFLTKDK